MLALAFTIALAAQGSCDSAPAYPQPPPASLEAAPAAAYETARHIDGYEDAFLGVGYLEPQGTEHYYDWHQFVTIPLYRAPGEEHVGWIHRGWVTLGSERKPFSYAGTTETDYEQATLIALEVDPDGWIRIRYDRERDGDPGTAWTHQCLLSLGELALSLRLWRDWFRSEQAAALYYRKRVPHALRAAPTDTSERLVWIGPDDEVEALEVRGEWMRVNVYQPGKLYQLCTADGPWQGETHSGWIQWWDERSGPRLYWPTRGC